MITKLEIILTFLCLILLFLYVFKDSQTEKQYIACLEEFNFLVNEVNNNCYCSRFETSNKTESIIRWYENELIKRNQ